MCLSLLATTLYPLFSKTFLSKPKSLTHVIKLEESQHWQHGENRAQQKERKARGNYTCQRERKKQVEATSVWKEEETSKKKKQMEGTDVIL